MIKIYHNNRREIMKLRKIILSLSCAFICMCSLPSNIKANEEERYFITIEDSKADQYVSDTIGDFINLESGSLGYYLNNVNIGKGIYVANFDEENMLPSFYYPLYVNDNIEYVYRIYDDGTGTYQGIFGKTYAEEVKEYASKSKEGAGLWTADNDNELLLTENSSQTIAKSKFEQKANGYNLSDYEKKRSLNFVTADVTDTIEFTKRPQPRVYWDRSISYVEKQGNHPWCAAYVAAAAIREMANGGVRAKSLMDYFGAGQNDACSPAMIRQYSAVYGINFSMYNGVTSASKILSVIEKWNLVYGGYSSNIGNHALLIHGIDGNKVHVWNPWNLYSEWSSSAGTYKSGGTTFSMYRYGHFIK